MLESQKVPEAGRLVGSSNVPFHCTCFGTTWGLGPNSTRVTRRDNRIRKLSSSKHNPKRVRQETNVLLVQFSKGKQGFAAMERGHTLHLVLSISRLPKIVAQSSVGFWSFGVWMTHTLAIQVWVILHFLSLKKITPGLENSENYLATHVHISTHVPHSPSPVFHGLLKGMLKIQMVWLMQRHTEHTLL